MRLIKAALVGAIGLFLIITLFSLLIPSNVRVSRAVLVNNATATDVYQQIHDFNNWKNWHPVFTLDSAKLLSASNAGAEIMQRGKTITVSMSSADTTAVKFLLKSASENDVENEINIQSIPDQHAVQVEWRAITKLHWYPWEKFYGIFIDKLTGPGYDAALKGLKDYMERSKH